jgi:hypothetical protein
MNRANPIKLFTAVIYKKKFYRIGFKIYIDVGCYFINFKCHFSLNLEGQLLIKFIDALSPLHFDNLGNYKDAEYKGLLPEQFVANAVEMRSLLIVLILVPILTNILFFIFIVIWGLYY